MCELGGGGVEQVIFVGGCGVYEGMGGCTQCWSFTGLQRSNVAKSNHELEVGIASE